MGRDARARWMSSFVAVTVVLAMAPAALAASGDVTAFDIPTLASLPHDIVAGRDGALWFTERTAAQIGRITTEGTIDETPLEPGVEPTAIAVGPDDNLWFTEMAGNRIGKLSPGVGVEEFFLPTDGSSPAGITAGPDGAVWFTERSTSTVGRLTTDFSELLEFPTRTNNAGPTAITLGPDGALWVTERAISKVARVDLDGTMSEFSLPVGSLPSGIATGADGNLWVTLRGRNSIARMTPLGEVTLEVTIPTAASGTSFISEGPSDGLWFTETLASKVGRVTMDGSIKEFDAEPVSSPQGLTAGPDGEMWFAEANLNRIARLEIGPDVPPDTTSPTIDIVRPRSGSTFVLGSRDVDASYSCDDQGGSGLATCAGPVPSGSPVPTDDLGAQTFLVQASDVAGNTAQDATTYVVFRSIGGTLIEGPGRAGGWLTLELGMDLDTHGLDPLVAAASQQVACADPTNAVGDPEVVFLRTRIGRGGVLMLRWDTDRAWTAQCRTLTLFFGPAGWSGAPATFLASFGAGASAKPAAKLAATPRKPSR